MRIHVDKLASVTRNLRLGRTLTLAPEILLHIGRSLKVPPSRVYGVATFYNHFSLKPKGEHTCTVCMRTACYVKGAGEILGALDSL